MKEKCPYIPTNTDSCHQNWEGQFKANNFSIKFLVPPVTSEPDTDLTKEAYLAALNRFIARRGKRVASAWQARLAAFCLITEQLLSVLIINFVLFFRTQTFHMTSRKKELNSTLCRPTLLISTA